MNNPYFQRGWRHRWQALRKRLAMPLQPLRAGLHELLLPAHCLLCAAPLSDSTATLPAQAAAALPLLCPDCQRDLPRLHQPACQRCGHPLPPGTLADQPCGHCQRHPPAYVRCYIPWQFEHPLDHLVRRLKYHRRLLLAELFAAGLDAVIPPDFRPDRLLALPLHPQRLRQRGFNQAQEIARHLAARRGWRLDVDSLHRLRDTPPQAGHDSAARRRNVHHAFVCRQSLAGQHIALLDDVLTSGATVHSASRALLAQGAAAVTVLAVARAGQA